MASKEDLVTSLIKEHHQSLSEPTETTIAVIQDAADSIENKGDNGNENSNETGQEYVYWARRGELETAGEVEVSSSAIEYQEGKLLFPLHLLFAYVSVVAQRFCIFRGNFFF